MAKLKRNPNFLWGSYRGPVKVKDMEDLHVVNVTHMVTQRVSNLKKDMDQYGLDLADYANDRMDKLLQVLNVFKAEMKFRKIPETALADAPYSFSDDEGCERIWDYKENKFIIKPPAVRFIKDLCNDDD